MVMVNGGINGNDNGNCNSSDNRNSIIVIVKV